MCCKESFLRHETTPILRCLPNGIGLLLVFLALLLVTLAACQPEEQPNLPDETLARIMADLHIAEAATTGLTGYRKDSLLYLYYEQIFALHGVERAAYERDLRLLSRNEERLLQIVQMAERLVEEAPHEP